jgi:hypothetical protein
MPVSYSLGAHEPLAHRLRTGNAATDERQRYAEEVSDAALDRAVAIGADTVHIACYKGFGLAHEKDTIARAADFAARARKRDLRVSVYVQGAPVYYETFLAETPEAADWLVINQFGQHVPWGFQVFRRYMCLSAMGFIEYQQKMLRTVIDAVGPDDVFMDNVSWNPPPNDCHCPRCQRDFRRHLERTFGERLEDETGIASLDHVEIPRTDPFFYPPDSFRLIRDPIHQESVRFRVRSLRRYLQAMYDTVKSIDANMTFGCNAGCDHFRVNTPYTNGQWLEDINAATDHWSLEEFAFRPRVEPDGSVVSKARINKVAEFYGRTIGRGMWGEATDDDRRVTIGEALAFARGRLGGIGNLAAPAGYFDGIAPTLQWAKGLQEKIAAGKIVAPVATLRLLASQAFVRFVPMHYACMAEQALLEGHVPFLIATDAIFDRLDEFSVVVMPNISALSDGQVERLRGFAQNGGGLVLIGQSATTDERLRVRTNHPFADAFAPDALDSLLEMGPPHFVPRVDVSRLTHTIQGKLGDGNVAWLPTLTPTSTVQWQRDPYFPFRIVLPEEVRPPAEAAELVQLVKAVAPQPFEVEVEAPKCVMAEYRRDGDRLYVHLVNLATDAPARDVALHVSEPIAREAAVYPMDGEAFSVAPRAAGQVWRVDLDVLDRYALVEVAIK